jgi:ATP-dependent 26S proteasome regulatory subunit
MRMCEGWSGADIEGLVRDAGYLSLREDRYLVTDYDLEVAIERKGKRIQSIY